MRKKTTYHVALVIVGGAVVGASCSGMEMLTDAMVPDVSAQPGCASACTATGVQRVMTADTDPERLIGGEVTSSDGSRQMVAAGPLILTDVIFRDGSDLRLTVSSDASCQPSDYDIRRWLFTTPQVDRQNMHGAHIGIGAGKFFCVDNFSGRMSWSGFRPYE